MTDQTKKYANYFDEEEEENVEADSLNTQNTKNNLVENYKIVNQPKKQFKFKDTEVFPQKITNTEEKNSSNQKQSNSESSPKSGSDSSSKNSEYKIPFSKNKSKKENGNNSNINNNSKAAIDNKKNNSIDSNPEKDIGEQVEYYENLDDLMKANSDENMEYDLVGMDELQEYLAGGIEGLDFDLKDMETEDPEKEIEKLEKNFNEDPLNYETLYKLIYLYRETKNAEKLKYFRNYTQMYFPISDDMWKEWIKDELIEINKNNPNNFDLKVQLIDLYERALRDFYYIKICKRFLKYLIFLKKERESKYPDFNVDEKYADYFTLDGIRKKFENILDIWGLDFNLSQKVWDIYLDFEKENYNNFRNSGNEDETFKTENIIRSIFRRRLSFPHIDLDIVWKDYKNWEKNQDNLEKVEQKYKESSQKCEEFINLEENFYELIEVAAKESYAGKLVLFLKVEIPKISKKYYNYAKLYYEKALEYNCDNFDIWKMYIEHTKINSKDKAWLVSIMLRSCKCCFFCIDLWKMLILEMEKNFYAKEDIQKKLQEAYQSVEERSEKLEIFVFSILFNFRNFVPKPKFNSDYSKKEINFEELAGEETNLNAKTVDPELESIRFEIKNLVEDLKTSKEIEILMQLYKFWAEFETYKTQDKKQMEEIMNELVRIDSSPEMWLNYLSYEKYFGDPTSIRKVFKRSIEYCKTDKKMLSVKWIEWESMYE